jgi:murein DD-endopeptidase MepM/ murein hydrolase activator NlpD
MTKTMSSVWLNKINTPSLLTDLGADIGSPAWWRGFTTMLALCASSVFVGNMASVPVIRGDAPSPAWSTDAINSEPLIIAPLRDGATTGWNTSMSPLARLLSEVPEKPRVERVMKLKERDTAEDLMRQAGLTRVDFKAVLAAIKATTDIKVAMPKGAAMMTLGRRATKHEPRPLERFIYRAAFEHWVEVKRNGDHFSAKLVPIKIDNRPLRIVGTIGSSLSASAREIGAPRGVAEEFLKQMSYAIDFERDVRKADRFEMLFEREVAETGDVRTGNLLHAVLVSNKKEERIELTRFAPPGEKQQYFTPDGVTVKRLLMKTPIDGARMVSGFGWRLHPILGYSRLHRGIDFAASSGTPIMAAGTGTIVQAGRSGGYGNYVKIRHQGGYETAYAHLSGFGRNVAVGKSVEQGQIIGFVGTTGLSTGPHLHYEIYAKGAPVNPNDAKLPVGRWLEGAVKNQFSVTLQKWRSASSVNNDALAKNVEGVTVKKETRG